EPKENSSDDSSSSSITTKLLYDKDSEKISSVKIENQNGSYTVTRNGSGYSVDGYEGLPLDDTYLSAIVESTASVTAKQIIEENAEDLEKYGLGNDASKVEVTFSDSGKTVKKFRVGKEAYTAGQVYFMLDGDKTVYTVQSDQFQGIQNGKENVISHSFLETPESDDKYPVIDEVSITGKDISNPIVLKYDASLKKDDKTDFTYDTEHIMTSPVEAPLIKENATAVIRGLFVLNASEVYKVHPSAEDLKGAGLDDPSVIYSMKTEGKTYTFKIGNPITENSSDSYYGYFEGTDIIYIFDLPMLGFAKISASDMIQKVVTEKGLYDLKKLEIITSDKHLTLDIEGADNDALKVKLNGKEFDKAVLQAFYPFILSTPCDTLYFDEPKTDNCQVKLILTDKFGNESVIEYYDNQFRRSAIKKNGKSEFTCNTSYVDRLIGNIALLEAGENPVTSW
ncbi:MAG TPA: DUF4340 domain-containing protein, partial [Oscillospiraceae bacterium]|nr:DUF4340 domain-containing protein [Oscillospiraceae bacterium]